MRRESDNGMRRESNYEMRRESNYEMRRESATAGDGAGISICRGVAVCLGGNTDR